MDIEEFKSDVKEKMEHKNKLAALRPIRQAFPFSLKQAYAFLVIWFGLSEGSSDKVEVLEEIEELEQEVEALDREISRLSIDFNEDAPDEIVDKWNDKREKLKEKKAEAFDQMTNLPV